MQLPVVIRIDERAKARADLIDDGAHKALPFRIVCATRGHAKLYLARERIGRHRGICKIHKVIQFIFDARFTFAEYAHHARIEFHPASRLEIGQNRSLEHRLHLMRRPGQKDGSLPFPLDDAAGSRAVGVGHNQAARREHRLLDVVGRHLAAHFSEASPDVREGCFIEHQLAVKGLGHGLFCKIIARGAEAARENHEFNARECALNGFFQAPGVIAHGRLQITIHAEVRKPLGKILRVRVEDVPQQQFRSDKDQFAGHRFTLSPSVRLCF